MFSILGSIAEFEREIISERIEEGKARAKAKGTKFGRKPTLTPEQRQELVSLFDSKAMSGTKIAKYFGIARSTAYKILSEEKEK